MARKDLAGLAALGALGYMLTKDKGDSAPSMRGGAEDERPAPTGMGEATQLLSDRNENFSNEGRTGVTRTPIGAVPRPRASTSSVSPASGGPRRGPGFETGSGGGRGPAFGEAEAYRQRQFEEADARARTPQGQADRAKMEQAQALEAVRPEEAMIGGGGLKTVAAMARGLAGRKSAAAGGEKLAEYITPELGYSQKLLQGPTKQLTGPSKAELVARDRAARAAEREAGRKEFNQRGVDRFVESTFEGGMKRGGKVKKMASGGMARSSASKRGDGIASKGKTKGRIY
jgi:hypothetical protein